MPLPALGPSGPGSLGQALEGAYRAEVFRLLAGRDLTPADPPLDTTGDRATAVRGILGSDPIRQRALDAVYAQVLQRPVDPLGQSVWFPSLKAGASAENLAVALLFSPEFANRTAATVA